MSDTTAGSGGVITITGIISPSPSAVISNSTVITSATLDDFPGNNRSWVQVTVPGNPSTYLPIIVKN